MQSVNFVLFEYCIFQFIYYVAVNLFVLCQCSCQCICIVVLVVSLSVYLIYFIIFCQCVCSLGVHQSIYLCCTVVMVLVYLVFCCGNDVYLHYNSANVSLSCICSCAPTLFVLVGNLVYFCFGSPCQFIFAVGNALSVYLCCRALSVYLCCGRVMSVYQCYSNVNLFVLWQSL